MLVKCFNSFITWISNRYQTHFLRKDLYNYLYNDAILFSYYPAGDPVCLYVARKCRKQTFIFNNKQHKKVVVILCGEANNANFLLDKIQKMLSFDLNHFSFLKKYKWNIPSIESVPYTHFFYIRVNEK